MSYAASAALQTAVHDRLAQAATLAALIGGAIHDAVPPGVPDAPYVLLGGEEVRDRSDISGAGAEHRFQVSVVSPAASFRSAKQVAAAVSEALIDAPLSLTQGHLVGLWFRSATARRIGGGAMRRIDLTFAARIDG